MRDRQDTGMFHALVEIEEKELRGALTRALDLLDLGFLIYGEGRVLYANRALERLVGYTAEELTTADPFDIIAPLDREMARERGVARAAGEDVPSRYVLQATHRSGALLHIELSVAQLKYDGNDRMLVLLRDVTAERAMEDRVRHAQKMAAIGKLAQGVAHDFSSYLTAIRLTSEALALRARDPESRKLLAEVEQVTKGASRLTHQLVTFGGLGATRFSVLDLNVVVFEVLNMVQRLLGEQYEISPDLEPGLPPVRADEGQLQQVVVNLVLNAGDSMPGGGKVTIRTRVDPANQKVVLSVSDEGAGIPPAVLDRAFEPFFGTKGPQSSGMGLAIVYGIVQQCGGDVRLESKEGFGTTATVSLPAATPPFPPVRQHRSGSTELRESAARVLLVEDEEFVRRLLTEGLERLGFIVCAAGDGLEAMRLMEEFEADALVTDVMLPGANGDEVAARFRELRPDAAVLFVSGYPNPLDVQVAAKESFLHKPFSASELAAAINGELET